MKCQAKSFFNKFKKNSPKVQKSMIEKEFNDRIYTKSTAKREKYTIFMLQNIGLFPLLDSATCVHIQKKPPELLQVRRLQSKTAATYSPTVTQYHRRDKA